MGDLKLNNGTTAKYLYEDYWHRPVYAIEKGHSIKQKRMRVCCINLNGTHLHTMSKDGEPEFPVSHEWQPIAEAK